MSGRSCLASRVAGAAIIGYLAVTPVGQQWLSWTVAIGSALAVLVWSSVRRRQFGGSCAGACGVEATSADPTARYASPDGPSPDGASDLEASASGPEAGWPTPPAAARR